MSKLTTKNGIYPALPLRQNEAFRGEYSWRCLITGMETEGKSVSFCYSYGLTKEEAEANAALIVKTINEHLEILFALKMMRGMISPVTPGEIKDLNYVDSVIEKVES